MRIHNTISYYWNDTLVLDARASGVMCQKICEGAAENFTAETRRRASSDLFRADLLSYAVRGILPATHFEWSDETGTASIFINMKR